MNPSTRGDEPVAPELEPETIPTAERIDDEPIDPTGLARHVELAADALASGLSSIDGDTADVLTDVALFSPGNIAYRVVMRIAAGTDATTPMGLFRASAHLANGLRSLFNRPDTIKLIEKLALAGDAPFWRQVLAYCAAGNLEAALDEYLHHRSPHST